MSFGLQTVGLNPMVYRTLTKNKFKVSRMGLGTVQFGSDYGYTKQKDQAEVDEILDYCGECGINLIDTARDYGTSEMKIGKYLKSHPGHSFVLATKIKNIDPETARDGSRLAAQVADSVKASLKALGVDHVDLLLLHQTDSYVVQKEEFWQSLDQMKKLGLFRGFGISIYEPQEGFELIEDFRDFVDVIQGPYNAFDQRCAPLFAACRERGIGVVSRSAFLKGVMVAEEKTVPSELEGIMGLKKKLTEISRNTGFSICELALLFAVNSEDIDSTIVGVGSLYELKANVRALGRLEEFRSLNLPMKELETADAFLIDPRLWSEL